MMIVQPSENIKSTWNVVQSAAYLLQRYIKKSILSMIIMSKCVCYFAFLLLMCLIISLLGKSKE